MNSISINTDDLTITICGQTKVYQSFELHNVAVTKLLSDEQIWQLINVENKSNTFFLTDQKFAEAKLLNPVISIRQKTFISDLITVLTNSKVSYESFTSSLWDMLCSLKWNEKTRLFNQLELLGYYRSNQVKKTNIGDLSVLINLNLGIDFMLNVSRENYTL